jgi:hypothetical protein
MNFEFWVPPRRENLPFPLQQDELWEIWRRVPKTDSARIHGKPCDEGEILCTKHTLGSKIMDEFEAGDSSAMGIPN